MSLLSDVEETLNAPLTADIDWKMLAIVFGIVAVVAFIAFDILKIVVHAIEDAAA